jgi:ribosomal protein L17
MEMSNPENETNTPSAEFKKNSTEIISSTSSSITEKTKLETIEEETNYVEEIFNSLEDIYGEIVINKNNFFLIVVKAVELVDDIKELAGLEKKKIVTDVLKRIILNLNLDDTLEKELLNGSIDSIIDTIIDVSRKGNKKNKNKVTDKLTVNTIVHELVNKIVSLVKKCHYSAIEISAKMITIVSTLIDLSDEYPYLTSVEKKEVIIQTLQSFIKKKLPELVEIDDNAKAVLEMSIHMIPQMVDGLLAIKHNEFLINIKKNKFVKKCCPCCY